MAARTESSRRVGCSTERSSSWRTTSSSPSSPSTETATPRPLRNTGVHGLHRRLDVLGVVVDAADDDEVLRAACDVESSVEDESKVPRPQIHALVAGDSRPERTLGVLPLLPVAGRDARARDPSLRPFRRAAPPRSRGRRCVPCDQGRIRPLPMTSRLRWSGRPWRCSARAHPD